jgi:signal transduction histidine kinase
MAATQSATILIVDDDRGLLRLLERALKRERFATSTASSGQEAIVWLSKNTADLMLLDLKLQDIEGKELVNHLVSIGRSLPFIIITGQGDERVAVEMMKRGALDYLVKDVQFIELMPEVVRRALHRLDKDKELAATQAALEESRREVLAITERERTRFGAELHDGLGQQLTAIELMCQSLKEDLQAANPDLAKQTAQICQFLREAIAQTRSLARDLSPVKLGSGGLPEALNELALRTSEARRVKCTAEIPALVTIDNELAAGHLYRIAQEAVHNAAKHTRATEIIITLADNRGVVRLEVSDNGQGLPKTPRAGQGIGLQVMKHRASIIGADLKIESAGGKGVTVVCTCPNNK